MQNDLALGLLALPNCWYRGKACPRCSPASTVPPVATLIAAPRSGNRSGPAAAPSSLLGTSSFSASAKRTLRWTSPCGGKLAGLPRRSKVDSDSDDDDDEDGGLDDVDEATEAGNQCVDLDTLHQGFTMILVSSKVSGPTPTDRRDADNLGISPPPDRLSHCVCEDFTALSPNDARLGSPPDFQRISPNTLQHWQQRLSGDGSADSSSDDDGARRVRTLRTSADAEPRHPTPWITRFIRAVSSASNSCGKRKSVCSLRRARPPIIQHRWPYHPHRS